MAQRTIGRLAREVGVGVETIRLYERKKLIPRPARPRQGFREYPEEARIRLLLIRRAKELGFSLKEIKDLLVLFEGGRATCGEITRRAQGKLADLDARMAELKRIRDSVAELAEACRCRPAAEACPAFSLEHWKRGLARGEPCCDPRTGRRSAP